MEILPAIHKKNDIFPGAVEYARIVPLYSEKYLSDPISGQKPESSTDTPAGKWTSNLNLELLSVLDGTAGQDLTEFGTTAKASWEELKINPAVACARLTSPVTMVIPDGKRITPSNDVVIIEGVYDGLVCAVNMDIDAHANATPSEQGRSIGH